MLWIVALCIWSYLAVVDICIVLCVYPCVDVNNSILFILLLYIIMYLSSMKVTVQNMCEVDVLAGNQA